MECSAIVICLTNSVLLVSGVTLNIVPQYPYRQSVNPDVIQQYSPIQQSQEPQVHTAANNNNAYPQGLIVPNNKIGYQIPPNYQQHPGVSNAMTDPTDTIIEHLRQHYINNLLSNPQGTCVDSEKNYNNNKKTSDAQVSISAPDAIPQVVNNYFIVSPEYLQNKNGRTARRQNNERNTGDRRDKTRKGTKRRRTNKDSDISPLDADTKSDSYQDSIKNHEDSFNETTAIDEETVQHTTNDRHANRFAVNANVKKNRRKCKHKSTIRQKLAQTENSKTEKESSELISKNNSSLQTSKVKAPLESNVNNVSTTNGGLADKLRTKVLSTPEDAISNFSSALKDELKKRKNHLNSLENCKANNDLESCDNDLFINTPSHNDKKVRIHRKTMKDENEELSCIEETDDEKGNIIIRNQFQDQNQSWEVLDNDANISIEEQLAEPEKDPNNYRRNGFRENNKMQQKNYGPNNKKVTESKAKPTHKINAHNLRKNKLLVQQRNNRNRFCKRRRPDKFEQVNKSSANSKHNSTTTQNNEYEHKKNEVESCDLDKHIKTRPVLRIKSVTNDVGSKRVVEESTTYKSIRKNVPENDDTTTNTPQTEIETVYGHSKVVKYGSVDDDDTPFITYYLPENMQYEVDGKTVVIAKSIPVDSFM